MVYTFSTSYGKGDYLQIYFFGKHIVSTLKTPWGLPRKYSTEEVKKGKEAAAVAADKARRLIIETDAYKNDIYFKNAYQEYLSKDWGGIMAQVKDLLSAVQYTQMHRNDPFVPPTGGTGKPGEMTFSQTGQDYLKYIEVINTYAKDKGYLVFNNQDELIGIRPHNVGDGSITVGFGHYIQSNEWNNYPKKYGITKGMSNSQLQSTYMPIQDCIDIFEKDISQNVGAINKFAKDNNIFLSQNEFDALVIYRYNKGSLNQNIRDMLTNNNRNRSDWENEFYGGNNNSKLKVH